MLIDKVGTLELHDDGKVDTERQLPIRRAGCPVCGNWEEYVENVIMAYWQAMKMIGDGKHKGCSN